ncbi:phosphate signaling complex protein PhoU [Terriglobus tenax]|uniref:phosphate signaling complex protein PhoU n=1 Tax=Terriglobus tenax TaxID=1111115 RepID=UPI0021E004D8|nr:phosphate signaling complex protein PhoU [Terriglobus tenax]
MPRIHFHQQLAALKDKLLAMAALAHQVLEYSVTAYVNGDMQLCEHVLEIEAAINAAEREVDEMAYELLSREQPMAIDLRFILSVIKINGDLERIGDQSVNVAQRARSLAGLPPVDLPVNMTRMGERAGKMIRLAIQALVEGDAVVADQVLAMDDEMDLMNREAQDLLVELMMLKPETTDHALNAIIIARNLERTGDHATNIAEDVIFWVRGSDVRHKMTLAEAE